MAEGCRDLCGGILGLLDLIEEHPGAFDYDWRTRFQRPASIIGTPDMGWGEAVRLVKILRADPSSMLAAALEGWTHPVSREALILMDQFDLDMQVATSGSKGKKPSPHPGRPWKTDDKQRTRKGNAAGRSMAEIRDILNAHGHALPPI